MKQFIFALLLIYALAVIGVSSYYANATMIVGGILFAFTMYVLLKNEIDEEVKGKTHMKL